MKISKLRLATATGIALLTCLLVFSSLHNGVFLVYAADEYGSDINFVEVWQYEDSAWILRHNITSSSTYRISDSQPTSFVVNVKFNETLAEDEDQAADYTRVTMNITGVWTSESLNYTSISTADDFYWLVYVGNWTESLPTAGESYSVSVLFEGYY
jgi:hypothetical protein